MKFIPSIIAENESELKERFEKVKDLSNVFHLDVMDSKFVKDKSLMFDFVLPKNNMYEIHLMMKNPIDWISKNWNKGEMFLVHVEALEKNFFDIKYFLKSKGRKLGIVLNPKTSVKRILDFLDEIDKVVIMTVNPGQYGASFIKDCLKKIDIIKNINSTIEIQVDGGINEKNIFLVPEYVDSIVLGSYLQNANYPKKAIKLLKNKVV